MKTLKMTGVLYTLRQKLLSPEFIFLAYTLVSWGTRLYLNYRLPQTESGLSTVVVTFPVSIFITIIFIWISYVQKIDWYGRKKTGTISRVIKFFSERKMIGALLVVLFFIDPFLFFIYFKNGHTTKMHYLLAWFLLILILLITSIGWMGFGFLIQLIT